LHCPSLFEDVVPSATVTSGRNSAGPKRCGAPSSVTGGPAVPAGRAFEGQGPGDDREGLRRTGTFAERGDGDWGRGWVSTAMFLFLVAGFQGLVFNDLSFHVLEIQLLILDILV